MDAEDPQSNLEIIPGSWRQDAQLPDMEQRCRGNANKGAKKQRDCLLMYVNSHVGSAPWQDELLKINN